MPPSAPGLSSTACWRPTLIWEPGVPPRSALRHPALGTDPSPVTPPKSHTSSGTPSPPGFQESYSRDSCRRPHCWAPQVQMPRYPPLAAPGWRHEDADRCALWRPPLQAAGPRRSRTPGHQKATLRLALQGWPQRPPIHLSGHCFPPEPLWLPATACPGLPSSRGNRRLGQRSSPAQPPRNRQTSELDPTLPCPPPTLLPSAGRVRKGPSV